VGDEVKRNHIESQIQQTIVEVIRLHPLGHLLFAIPNGFKIHGTPAQRRAKGARWKREGLTPGVLDLFLPVARFDWHGLFVEVKEPVHGQLSKEQKVFQADVTAQGFLCYVVDNAQDGIDLILEYLKGEG
jgi:hypothetical protein